MAEVFSTLMQLELKDIVDILVIAFIIYHALLLVKGTRGWQMTLGVIALGFFYYLIEFFQLRTVQALFSSFLTVFIFALIVIFQSEIRRGLAQLGGGGFFSRLTGRTSQQQFEEIVLAATTLSSQKIGGLMVIEKDIGLKNYIESGVKLDAFLTYELLLTIFNPRSSLHDAAVIVKGNRLAAAGCFLPLTRDPYLSKKLGTRHRAAIGITEETDALALVISEETGKISAVLGGEITPNLDGSGLIRFLEQALATESERPKMTNEGDKSVGKQQEVT